MLNIDAAWEWAGGWTLIGVADSGLQVNNPDLRAVDGLSFVGGPFIRALSYDAGSPDAIPSTPAREFSRNVDERAYAPFQGVPDPACLQPASVCSVYTPGYANCMYPIAAGHGSHVSGLLAANAANIEAINTKGVCRYCSIAAVKISFHICDDVDPSPNIVNGVITAPSGDAIAGAMSSFSKSGVVDASLSFGFPEISAQPFGLCSVVPDNVLCTSAKTLATSDVVAAAANDRTVIRYPGSDVRFLNAVGVNEAGLFWDRSPPNPDPNTTTCPTPGSNVECGSNYQAMAGFRLPDVAAQAANVLSVTYGAANWNVGCGDSYGAPSWDGKCLCTGTSMSTPQIAGVLAILRSINPLVRAVNPTGTSPSPLQQVLYDSADRALATPPLPRDFRYGYGILDAEQAVKRMLGRVRGQTVRNRVTPMFSVYNAALGDYASTPTPQAAMALIRYGSFAYSPAGVPGVQATPGYGAFPYDPDTTAPPVPQAAFYVLTTDKAPYSQYPQPIPLYWLRKQVTSSADCDDLLPECTLLSRDTMTVATVAQVEQALAQGYEYLGRQGYIYPPCGTGCALPPGVVRLYRLCNPTTGDCALSTEVERGGYVDYVDDTLLGWVYPNIDTDGDQLVNGLEDVIGTNPDFDDSDGDGIEDGMEYPAAGIPDTDPCDGPNIQCDVAANLVFADSFEG